MWPHVGQWSSEKILQGPPKDGFQGPPDINYIHVPSSYVCNIAIGTNFHIRKLRRKAVANSMAYSPNAFPLSKSRSEGVASDGLTTPLSGSQFIGCICNRGLRFILPKHSRVSGEGEREGGERGGGGREGRRGGKGGIR